MLTTLPERRATMWGKTICAVWNMLFKLMSCISSHCVSRYVRSAVGRNAGHQLEEHVPHGANGLAPHGGAALWQGGQHFLGHVPPRDGAADALRGVKGRCHRSDPLPGAGNGRIQR